MKCDFLCAWLVAVVKVAHIVLSSETQRRANAHPSVS